MSIVIYIDKETFPVERYHFYLILNSNGQKPIDSIPDYLKLIAILIGASFLERSGLGYDNNLSNQYEVAKFFFLNDLIWKKVHRVPIF